LTISKSACDSKLWKDMVTEDWEEGAEIRRKDQRRM